MVRLAGEVVVTRDRVAVGASAAGVRGRHDVDAADLSQQTEHIEVHPLVGDAITLEEEHGDGRDAERPSGRGQAEELTGVGAEQIELGDDRVVITDVESHVLVALVGEGEPLVAVIGEDCLVPVVNLAGGDDLVTRMTVEGREARRPVVIDLGLKVRLENLKTDTARFGEAIEASLARVVFHEVGHRATVEPFGASAIRWGAIGRSYDPGGVSDSLVVESPGPTVTRRGRSVSFELQLAVIVVVGAAWRGVMLARNWNRQVGLNDALYYTLQASDIAHGRWFWEPFRGGPSAEHGPLTSLVLATVSFGNDPVPWQRLVTTLFGVATIIVIGLLGRLAGGERVGLVAAGLAAVYPNLWLSDGLVMSESISVCLVSLASLLLLKELERPITRSTQRWGGRWWLVGAVFGLSALARSETVVMIPMAAVVASWLPDAPDGRGRRLVPGAALLAAAMLVLLPWVAFNLSRFERPVFLTTNDGTTLAGAYCDDSFYGRGTGGWTVLCLGGPLDDKVLTEPSVRSEVRRDAALDYLGDHVEEMPRVVAARLGRVLDLYGLDSMVVLDTGEGRPLRGVWAGIVAFWVLAPLAIAGFVMQRRAARWTLALPVITVVLTTVVFYGAHRIRSTAEPAIVVAAATAIVAVVRRWSSRRIAPS